MRLSRWGQSPYETSEDLAREAEALAGWVELVPPGVDAEVVVVHSKIPFGAAQCDETPSLRMLVTTTSGTDHIDLGAAQTRGIAVVRLPLARANAVVDATVAMLIWGLRRMGRQQQFASDGTWGREQLPQLAPIGLAGAKVGLIGQGVIGTRVTAVLRVLGCEVWAADPRGVPAGCREATLDEMVVGCDAVSLHCDLNPSTQELLSASRLEVARPGLVLVNTARGGLLDFTAACAALERGVLGALALDVFPEEPFSEMSRVNGHPGLLFTPHAAGYHAGLAAAVRAGLCRAVGALCAEQELPHRVV